MKCFPMPTPPNALARGNNSKEVIVMMRKYRVNFRVDEEGNRYPFLDVGSEGHGRPSFRLWISGRLLQRGKDGEYYLSFPVQGARIYRTEKGSLVLRPAEGWRVENIYVPCGFRGDSGIRILAPEGAEWFEYYVYASPRGRLGISEGMLVNVPRDAVLKFEWGRTGRLYGDSPEGITIVMPDGEERPFEEVPDGLEALGELPTMED